ncbi:flavin-containing monooxygenase [Sphingobium nicotianae]|uniref:NAD(P)/FAD-dependent oxidoreductase n=1 Tax=Sphingobium nicotianae TaxID=2782607 RepID=A0A9X1DC12_9SPHN|nr:NAD(P)/FAD-dependent oxidoreductase [Sphingobium nicotianae]MBT2187367.1 NAD(P)/FAD-dependent oxidoreductase [Sphingobium nicotianae]
MTDTAQEFDAVVIGAGFAGIYMLHKLRQQGLRVRLFEAGDGPGGAWYWNRYPGARCDSESYFYCYFFSDEILQEWSWSERFPAQPEIERYLNYVSDKLDLRKDMTFGARVTTAAYDEQANRWTVETSAGDKVTARYVVTAIGGLTSTAANLPDIPGVKDFQGEWYHTGHWPREGVDFRGKRVGVLGTGSTGIQAVPVIAETAGHLTVFQRTPAYIMPAKNHPLTEEYNAQIKANYPEIRAKVKTHWGGQPYDAPAYSFEEVTPEQALALQEEYWNNGGLRVIQLFKEGTRLPAAREFMENFFREKVRSIVKDPAKAEILEPKGYPMGAKRIALDTNYYETFNLPHVDVVDVRKTPITRITEKGILVGDTEYPLDVIVFATGYDAVTGPFRAMDIRGRGGMQLRERLDDGPRSYLGMSFYGFPNLLAVSGPANPALSTNVPASIEHDVEWISDIVDYAEKNGFKTIEPTEQAEDDWTEETQAKARGSVFDQADSWQYGSNVPGKPRRFLIWLGGLHTFRDRCAEVTREGYKGFTFTK